ncbi:unnamed protein product [Spirodela intermedia]|uniref:Uncharacterized protein n=1 Tax=Spirodela intermedia TaxID=51605 RepID=A0A7I8JLF6_SPIIN|nr:unnamed protein product [Spirodela intermedia]CAA6670591.1 unnamed protein product [Spirodela intermedia]
MSVLGRRLAGTEGAYFLRESKNAAGRLAAQNKKGTGNRKPSVGVIVGGAAAENLADVLPEVLRHSIPLRPEQDVVSSSLAEGCKWTLGKDVPASFPRQGGAMNPLREYVSLPQVTLGPKRWRLPDGESSILASTANELRRDRYPEPVDSEKLKAAAAGLSQIGKAFAIATTVVLGGATSVFVLTASKLHIQSTDDVRARGRDLIQPAAEFFRERMGPFRTWAENNSRKWRPVGGDGPEEKEVIKQLSKTLGRRDF